MNEIRTYSFEDLISVIRKRLSLIDFEKESYSYEIYPEKTERLNHQSIIVKFENRNILKFKHYISNTKNIDVSKPFRLPPHPIYFSNDSRWYHEEIIKVYVNEVLDCNYYMKSNYSMKQNIPLNDALDELLPISDHAKSEIIISALKDEGLDDFQVQFDTLNKRYVILGNINQVLKLVENINKDSILTLYKYMSLNTYLSMLDNKTYRMNSIISMNDESESLFLNDELFDIYSGDKTERYKSVIENSNTLISSFTDQHDSGLMWRLYGDNGKGIRLGFKVDKDKIKKIHYINERSEGYQKLKGIVNSLKSQDIDIVFKDADNFKFYMKSDGFRYEDEYRLSYYCEEENLSWAKYGNLISPYRDFPFSDNACEELGLELSEVLIGAKLPNFDVNYPLLVKRTNEVFKVSLINISKQNKFRE